MGALWVNTCKLAVTAHCSCHPPFLTKSVPCFPLVQAYNCKGVYFEDSDVWGTTPGGWALTYIAVQYGHICRSKVHYADWCSGLTGRDDIA
jgi:hypothetical protein